MSVSTGSKEGGELGVTTKDGEILVITTVMEVVTGIHPDINPFMISVKVPVEVTLDQSKVLRAGEKVRPVGLMTVASL